MKRKIALCLLIFFSLCIGVIFISGCSPSESAVQTAIAETDAAKPTFTPSLTSPPPTNTPSPTPIPPTTSTPELVGSNLLTLYGWTISSQISSHTVTLPKSFQHYPGDFPYAIYWAYNNEFNKDIGLDLAPYLGQTVQASLYLLNEPLPEEFRQSGKANAVVIEFENEVIGAWIDQGRHAGFACSLNRKNFTELVNQDWSDWLVSAGVVDLSNEIERELSTKTPEEIIELYYTAMNDGDYQILYSLLSRRNLASRLFINKDDLALFNHQEDEVITRWVDNIENVRLLGIQDIPNRCLPLFQARAQFEFLNPLLSTIPEGENLRFVVLSEEIEGLGWRIEEVNTAPGVSDYLCPP